jgi:uncharacterized protein YdeI (YjbR/CyaY-like superfamily)
VNLEEPTFFESAVAFRGWLDANHDRAQVLNLGYYKKGSKRPSISYPESVDEALCFGWIDGVRHAIDGDSYTVRFTPRKPGSIWSARNVARVQELIAEGHMTAPGLAAFEARNPDKTNMYSLEQQTVRFTPEFEAKLKANKAALAYFQAQPPGYRRIATWWVMSAKQEATRQRRLALLIEDCAAGRRLAASLPRRPER